MILSVSTLNLKKDEYSLLELNKTNLDYLHIDIMDNIFVPNYVDQFEFLNDNINLISKPLDIHLMVEDVKKYVDLYSVLNPMYITFHIEVGNTLELINYIKEKNIKVGLSIKPNTDIEEIIPYLNIVDLILVMSVEPGFGGQEFISDSTNKISELKKLQKDYNFLIEVDGGINNNNLDKIKETDIVVIGSFITKSDDFNVKIDEIKLNLEGLK